MPDPVRPRPDPIAALVERFDQLLSNCQLYGPADAARDAWNQLKAALRADADARPPQEWEAPFLCAAIQHALTFHQTTHVHAVLREALDVLSKSQTAVPRRAEPPLTANEQELVNLYRQNRCGDPDCEGARFSAAQSCLKGATTHREVADFVSEEMLRRSEIGIGDQAIADRLSDASAEETAGRAEPLKETPDGVRSR